MIRICGTKRQDKHTQVGSDSKQAFSANAQVAVCGCDGSLEKERAGSESREADRGLMAAADSVWCGSLSESGQVTLPSLLRCCR